MASANLMAMQSAVNRFAKVAGFSPIATDGGMGPATAQATLRALGWAAKPSSCIGQRCVPEAMAIPASQLLTGIIAESGAIDQTLIMQHTTSISNVLNMVADAVGIGSAGPPIATVPTNGGGLPAQGPFFPLPVASSGGFIKDIQLKFSALPMWQKAALGVAGVLALMAGAGALKKQRKAAA